MQEARIKLGEKESVVHHLQLSAKLAADFDKAYLDACVDRCVDAKKICNCWKNTNVA